MHNYYPPSMPPMPGMPMPGMPRPNLPTAEQVRQAQTDAAHFTRTLSAMVRSMVDDLYTTYGESQSDLPGDNRPAVIKIVPDYALSEMIAQEVREYVGQRDRAYALAFSRANPYGPDGQPAATTEPTVADTETDPDEDKPF